MSLKLAAAVLASLVVGSCPAWACGGTTVILADNFQTVDPAWIPLFGATLAISGGSAQLTVPAGKQGGAFYGSMFIDSGDYCIDMVGPAVADQTTVAGGILFGMGSDENYFEFAAVEVGVGIIVRTLNGKVSDVVQATASSALQTGGNAVNTLEVIFKGASGTASINGNQFATFNIPQGLVNTQIGFFALNETTGPITYKFSNVRITAVP
jgi:hypothetical protein